ncbi:hypothetical protein HIO71_12250 [Chryseobacterium aquaticum]|uniref:Uncharacterized protein n=1 Tax=Chryseobacterium aquaticum TaxID=452084 RepID=A0A848N883_9FLAO|nr:MULTISPECIES: hypothetical protein [Chryseobacterium]NMR34958.1 hypothetical protein [Chryseobacterium aquaticum]NRQ47178.1 hypothetical protein [Chryseobacterium sp. C-204]
MQIENFPYKGLHDYLDIIFRDIIPTEDQIAEAKKQYRKYYNSHLKRNYRNSHKQITLSLTKYEMELLKRKLESQQSVSGYIKKLVLAHLDNSQTLFNQQNTQKKDLAQVEQQLFILIDYLESLIYHRRFVDNTQIAKLEQHLLYLQQLLETQF